MGPPPVRLVLVVVLSLTATLPGPTMVHARGNSAAERYTRLYDLMNTRQNKFDTRRNRIDGHLDGKERFISVSIYIGCDFCIRITLILFFTHWALGHILASTNFIYKEKDASVSHEREPQYNITWPVFS